MSPSALWFDTFWRSAVVLGVGSQLGAPSASPQDRARAVLLTAGAAASIQWALNRVLKPEPRPSA